MIKLCQMYFKATAATCDVYSRLASYLVGEYVGVLTKMESLLLLNTVKVITPRPKQFCRENDVENTKCQYSHFV